MLKRLRRLVGEDIKLLWQPVAGVATVRIDPRLANLVVDARDAIASGNTADGIACHGVLEQGVHFIQKPFAGHDRTSKTRAVLDQG